MKFDNIPAVTAGNAPSPAPMFMEDSQLLAKARQAKNAARFNALWSGDVAGFGSHSDADFALISLLSFYTQDAVQLDRLFRASGLMREKWDRAQGGTTYGAITIERALNACRATYDPRAYFRRISNEFRLEV